MSGVGDEAGQPILGTCPDCDETIPRGNLLISYQAEGDWPRMFAECPVCEEPVHPQ